MGARYVSEHTKFIADLKQQNPLMEEGQREGRSIFWDKRIDLDELKRFHEAEVQQPAYAYQNYVGPPRDPQPCDVVTPGTPSSNKS